MREAKRRIDPPYRPFRFDAHLKHECEAALRRIHDRIDDRVAHEQALMRAVYVVVQKQTYNALKGIAEDLAMRVALAKLGTVVGAVKQVQVEGE